LTLSPRRKAALIIAALFLVLGSLAIYASPLSAHSLERRLAFAAEDALYAVRADEWVRMEVNGQVVTLSGQAPSRAAKEEALLVVSRSSWAGGAVAGGVTRVVDEIRLAHEGEDVRLSADLSGGRLVLTGFAPDAEAADQVRARAERLFPDRAEVDLRIAPGSAPPGWDGAVRFLLAELARLDHGGGRIADGRIALTGLASSNQTLDTVRAAFDTPPSGFEAAALVRVDGGGFDGAVEDARLCDLLIDAALGQSRVSFTPGRATLAQGSQSLLGRAGRIYDACEAAPLIVAVRAEGEGEDAEALALERAEAIIAAMAGADPDRDRFLAESAPSDGPAAVRLSVQAAPAQDGEDSETTAGGEPDPADQDAPGEATEG
jgi:hypothetical protein